MEAEVSVDDCVVHILMTARQQRGEDVMLNALPLTATTIEAAAAMRVHRGRTIHMKTAYYLFRYSCCVLLVRVAVLIVVVEVLRSPEVCGAHLEVHVIDVLGLGPEPYLLVVVVSDLKGRGQEVGWGGVREGR